MGNRAEKWRKHWRENGTWGYDFSRARTNIDDSHPLDFSPSFSFGQDIASQEHRLLIIHGHLFGLQDNTIYPCSHFPCNEAIGDITTYHLRVPLKGVTIATTANSPAVSNDITKLHGILS
jgi:hypothetical protein